MKDFWKKIKESQEKKRHNDWVEIKDADRSCKAAPPCGKVKRCVSQVWLICQPVNDIWGVFWEGFHASNCCVAEKKVHEFLDEIFPEMESLCISAPIHFLIDLPDTRRTKGCDRSPVLVPPISRFLQHQINKLGPLRFPKYPVVVAVVPTLNLVNVGGKETV